jgi:ribosomal protein S18 acetylase RimI-like enzyme
MEARLAIHPEWHTDGLALLQAGDRRLVERFLLEHAAENAYLLAQIARGALDRDDIAGPLIGHWSAGQLAGICILGSNLVISEPASAGAIEGFAEYARRLGIPFWVAVGPDLAIQDFLSAYGRDTRRIRLERGNQVLYGLSQEAAPAPGGCDALRPAQLEDVEALVALDRRMVTEEIGFDPFATVLGPYRQGWIRRVREGRAWVTGRVGGDLAFKIDQSAVSRDAVQLAGIYTVPEARRRGIARGGVGEMCRLLLESTPRVTLYVHGDNTAAVQLYEALGFEPLALVRSVWFQV